MNNIDRSRNTNSTVEPLISEPGRGSNTKKSDNQMCKIGDQVSAKKTVNSHHITRPCVVWCDRVKWYNFVYRNQNLSVYSWVAHYFQDIGKLSSYELITDKKCMVLEDGYPEKSAELRLDI